MPTESISSLPNTRPTDASCEINEANGRTRNFAWRFLSLLLPLSRVNHDAHFLPKKLFLSISLLGVFVPLSFARFCHTQTQHAHNPTHRMHAYESLSLASSFMRGFATRIHARTHVERNTRSINTCNEIYFKPT